MRRFIACRVCRVLAWFPSCCGLAVFSSLAVSAPDPWGLPACTPCVGGCACSVFWFFIVHGIGCAPTRYAMGNHFVSSFDVPRMRLSFLACSVALSAVRQVVVQDGHVDRSGGRSMVARLACIAHCS
ncbi:putative amidotransferase [Bifidobacterium boum]|uniref:Putative amidotransferase n=1 Tax=Bifidobacterium boum TaxID=78343 RepID=A0A086ZPL8_9BIFI|nr:putative amidotransferase [Bifidobacterium boum]